MANITVDYDILAKGYQLSGDVRSGLHATVPYLVAWGDAFTFANQVLASPSAVRIGAITWTLPYQFPVAFGGVGALGSTPPPLYVQSFRIDPCGAGGSAIPNDGLAPGEFYTHAVVTLQFDSITSIQQASDDPQNLNQLDPENPITACEQSVKITGKVITKKGAGYTYDTGSFAGKPVPGDIPIVNNECKLVLKFPRVPYLPWQLVQPYVNKTNSVDTLLCNQGSLLLEGMDTDVTPAPNGTIAQKLALQFAFNPDPTGADPGGIDWNSFPIPDGSGYSTISPVGGGPKPYVQADFRQIFESLSF